LADFNGTRLEPLPSSRDEVLAIAHTFDSNAVILTGKQATETEFKGEPLSEFKVIHLATHAMPDPRYPVRAAVILGADDHDDGLLQVREILRFRLHADLVTLSACETGVGTLQGEAGMASLEQAFLTAGAKSTVGSLWKVEDYSTSALMKGFYRHLAEGEDKATALRGAKLDFLQRNANMSPYYWAGFTLWGEGTGSATS
jgi:CHAT domain-containing protein